MADFAEIIPEDSLTYDEVKWEKLAESKHNIEIKHKSASISYKSYYFPIIKIKTTLIIRNRGEGP